MSDVPVWRLFAYMDDDEDGERDETRTVTDWQLEDVLRWCRFRGYDHVYLRRIPAESVRFQRGAPVPVRHHMHVVEGSKGEQPGDAA